MTDAQADDGLWAPRGKVARAIVLCAMGVNLAASLGMALVLRGATAAGGDPIARMGFMRDHAVLVPAFWYLWILASLGLVVVFFALLRALPGRAAFKQLVFIVLFVGVVPDVANNLIGAAILPRIAARWAVADGPLRDALVVDFELWDRFSVTLTGVVGNLFYGIAGFMLAKLTARTEGFPRVLVWLQIPLWTATLAMVAASIADSTTALVGTVAATMALFCAWCTGVAFLYLGRDAE